MGVQVASDDIPPFAAFGAAVAIFASLERGALSHDGCSKSKLLQLLTTFPLDFARTPSIAVSAPDG
jgi:hypothetical protein